MASAQGNYYPDDVTPKEMAMASLRTMIRVQTLGRRAMSLSGQNFGTGSSRSRYQLPHPRGIPGVILVLETRKRAFNNGFGFEIARVDRPLRRSSRISGKTVVAGSVVKPSVNIALSDSLPALSTVAQELVVAGRRSW
jgi:hypothetical protein